MSSDSALVDWLLDSDPAIRWQVKRDLLDASPAEVARERGRIEVEGIGPQLLALQAPDGCWSGVAWNHGWNSTMHVLLLLRDLGVDPACGLARRAVSRVREQVTWRGCGPEECEDNGFFEGEVEPCINGQVAATGAYFGEDVRALIERLLTEQLPDGGWNCEADRGSTRSSFNTTLCVLEALLAHEERTGHQPQLTAARKRGEEFLLERHLCRRKSTGEVIARDRKGGADWTQFAFPTWWHYDLLRGLDYLRRAGVTPDERAAEAIGVVESQRTPEGPWTLGAQYRGVMPIELGERVGQPSRWITLRALRVLNWYHAQRTSPARE